jgi:5-methylcytosine-specific restriction enzyme B
MSQADEIRQFVISNYIEPARARGEQHVTVRAGDVHNEMGLKDALPAVCSAIGSAKFSSEAGVHQVGRVSVVRVFETEGGLI